MGAMKRMHLELMDREAHYHEDQLLMRRFLDACERDDERQPVASENSGEQNVECPSGHSGILTHP